MAGVKSYDSAQISVTVGVSIITGFQDGTFVSIVQNGDGWKSTTGADGHKARSKNQDQSAQITLTLQATSESNQVLSSLYDIDQIEGNGKFPIWVKDLRGNDLVAAPQAWVVKKPDAEYGTEVGSREWVIETGNNIIYNVGGNKE